MELTYTNAPASKHTAVTYSKHTHTYSLSEKMTHNISIKNFKTESMQVLKLTSYIFSFFNPDFADTNIL